MIKTYKTQLLCLFLAASANLHAQTISPSQFIKSRIAKADTVHIDHLRGFFESHSDFNFECVKDDNESENSAEAKAIFQEYGGSTAKGKIKIDLKSSDLGFDLILSKSQDHKFAEVFEGSRSLDCTISESDHCKALIYRDKKEFKVAKHTDAVTKSEAWTFWFKDSKIYANRTVDFEAPSYAWHGYAKSGTIRFGNTQVCRLIEAR